MPLAQFSYSLALICSHAAACDLPTLAAAGGDAAPAALQILTALGDSSAPSADEGHR